MTTVLPIHFSSYDFGDTMRLRGIIILKQLVVLAELNYRIYHKFSSAENPYIILRSKTNANNIYINNTSIFREKIMRLTCVFLNVLILVTIYECVIYEKDKRLCSLS